MKKHMPLEIYIYQTKRNPLIRPWLCRVQVKSSIATCSTHDDFDKILTSSPVEIKNLSLDFIEFARKYPESTVLIEITDADELAKRQTILIHKGEVYEVPVPMELISHEMLAAIGLS